MFQKPKRNVHSVFIHCSASDADSPAYTGYDLVKTITLWHKARGWSECGYHFVMDKKGVIVPARNIEKIPAGQKGFNTGTICICLHGLDKNKFTAEQRKALFAFCTEVNKAYSGKVKFRGHREVDKNKSCPVIDYKSWLGLDKFGYMKL